MKVRLVQPVGKLAHYMSDEYWLEKAQHVHSAYVEYQDGTDPAEKCQCACEQCGQSFEGVRSSWNITKWNTEDGKLHAGDMYWAECIPDKDGKCYYWDNCPGQHLIVRVPDADNPQGHAWNIDSRASNCTMKDDRTHRCWVRHGEPPNIHVDKNGSTCNAGAGSIQAGDYHGFLHNGEMLKGVISWACIGMQFSNDGYQVSRKSPTQKALGFLISS